MQRASGKSERKPPWLRVRLTGGAAFNAVSDTVREGRLHTVCASAQCPNLHECWGRHRTATFLILGDVCTRNCRFCAVTPGAPRPPDADEPERVADAVARMGLRHAVITMVTRDDLPDGGAAAMAAAIRAVRARVPECSVEVLVSDLQLQADAIAAIATAAPDIHGHNLETVRRLTPRIRPQADYDRSLEYLRRAKAAAPATLTKSSLMLGLGETHEEILVAMEDLRRVGTDLLNLGQYLRPTWRHAPVRRYWTPEEFDALAAAARARGFAHCTAGPLVRSSYHAGIEYTAWRAAQKGLPQK